MFIRKLLRHWFTEADGKSFDLIAALGSFGFVIAMGLQIYVTATTGEFSLLEFGTGLGAIMVAVTGGQRLKPESKPETE